MNGTALPVLPVRPSGHASVYPERPRDLLRALHLARLTVGWNIVEGVVAIAAALAAGSIALLGFGLDSFVETASGGIIVWRTLAERRAKSAGAVEQIERLAGRLVAVSLVALGLYIAVDAGRALLLREHPQASILGLSIAALSIVVMQWLAREKRKVGRRLHSRSIQADAFQTTACLYLSLIVLVGVGLNMAFGWWWADPAAALLMVVPLATEARDAWRGDPCCDDC